MSDRVQIIKGFQDIVPPRSRAFAAFEDEARRVFALYGYEEVRLPVLEKTELFARGIGPGTDIVDKEMFTFSDRKGRSLSLRPEGTACLVRAYLDSGKGKGEPEYYAATIRQGTMLFEIGGVAEDVARRAFSRVSHKMPFRCRFVTRRHAV